MTGAFEPGSRRTRPASLGSFRVWVLSCAGLLFGLQAIGCRRPETPAMAGITPLETTLSEAFAASDAGDAQRLFSLTSLEERREEDLTPEMLAKVLAIFRRETRGAAHGPVVVSGGSGLVSGEVTYRVGGETLTHLALVSRPDESGRPTVNVATGLIYAAVSARGFRKGQGTADSVADLQSMLSGLKALKPEFQAAGLNRIYRGGNSAQGYIPRVATETLDQEEDRLKKVLELKKARAAGQRPK